MSLHNYQNFVEGELLPVLGQYDKAIELISSYLGANPEEAKVVYRHYSLLQNDLFPDDPEPFTRNKWTDFYPWMEKYFYPKLRSGTEVAQELSEEFNLNLGEASRMIQFYKRFQL